MTRPDLGAAPTSGGNQQATTAYVDAAIAASTGSAAVTLTGTQTISGAKTFSIAPTLPSGSVPESAITSLVSDLAAKMARITTFSAPTAGFTAVAANGYRVDLTAGAFSVALPTSNTAGQTIFIQKTDSTVNQLTVTGTINGNTGASFTLKLVNQGKLFLADGTGNWDVIAGDISLGSLDLRFAPIIGTLANQAAGTYFTIDYIFGTTNAYPTRASKTTRTDLIAIYHGPTAPSDMQNGDEWRIKTS